MRLRMNCLCPFHNKQVTFKRSCEPTFLLTVKHEKVFKTFNYGPGNNDILGTDV